MDSSVPLPTPLQRSKMRVVQLERWIVALGWSSEHLFFTDGPEWNAPSWAPECKDTVAAAAGLAPREQVPPRGWVWTHGSEWAIESGKDTDEDGWQYAFNVDTEHPWQPKLAAQHFVRRRRWTRSVVYDPVAYLSGADTQVTTSTVRSARRVSREPIRRTYELFEHERWVVLAGWSAKHLFPTDPQQYTDVKGVPRAKEVQLSPHWSWTGEWRVEVTEHTDANGYAYAFNWGDETVWSSKMGAKDFVRRRKWLRPLQYNPPPEELDLGPVLDTSKAQTEANFSIITSPLVQEVMAQDEPLPTDAAPRAKLLADLEAVSGALRKEAAALEAVGRSAVQFYDMANKQRVADAALPLSNVHMEKVRAWILDAGNRTPLAPLPATASDDVVTTRAVELDLRISAWLEARTDLLAAEEALRPGALKAMAPQPDPPARNDSRVVRIGHAQVASDEEGEAEL